MNKETESSHGFWTSLPAVLTAIAALITAVAGALWKFWPQNGEITEVESITESLSEECRLTTQLSETLYSQEIPCLQKTTVFEDRTRKSVLTFPYERPRKSNIQAWSDLLQNKSPAKLVRIVGTEPETLINLGKNNEGGYVFVGDYDELIGLSFSGVKEALGIGGSGAFTLVIFDAEKNNIEPVPASYRGIVKTANFINFKHGKIFDFNGISSELKLDIESRNEFDNYKPANWKDLYDQYQSLFNDNIYRNKYFKDFFGEIRFSHFSGFGYQLVSGLYASANSLNDGKIDDRFRARGFLVQNRPISSLKNPVIFYISDPSFIFPRVDF